MSEITRETIRKSSLEEDDQWRRNWELWQISVTTIAELTQNPKSRAFF